MEQKLPMPSFDEIYEAYHAILFRSAYLMTGNRYDAEDVLQDTFLIAFTKGNQVRRKESYKAWLFRILTRLVYQKQKESMREYPEEEIAKVADGKETTASLQEEVSQRLDLQRYLLELKPKEREVIVLFYYNDLSIQEIASICRCSAGTIKSRLFSGRKALKAKFVRTEVERLQKEMSLTEAERLQKRESLIEEEEPYVERSGT